MSVEPIQKTVQRRYEKKPKNETLSPKQSTKIQQSATRWSTAFKPKSKGQAHRAPQNMPKMDKRTALQEQQDKRTAHP